MSPRTCIDASVPAGTYYYQATFTDADGVTGSPARTASTIAVAACGPFSAEGSSNPAAPTISIINPLKGTPAVPNPVSGKIRVQIRVFNPGGVSLISGLALSDNDGSTYAYTTFTALSTFDTPTTGTVTGRTFEAQITPTAGLHTLRARVTNTAITPTLVLSNSVPINVLAAGKGDGRLLVRDNSSQLCSDCHGGIMTHSSEAAGTEFGSWATTCRDCHTPHRTRNVSLVRESITAPALAAGYPANRAVVYRTNDGGYTASPTATTSGLANGASPPSGACQVCHTRTQYYRQDGFDYPLPDRVQTASGGHYPSQPGGCASCHKHTGGMQANCTGCHGDNSATPRTNYTVTAPPRDSCGNWTPNGADLNNRVGAHERHLIGGSYSNALACQQCHANPPTSSSNPNHPGTSCSPLAAQRAVMTWGALSKGGGWTATVTPSYTYASQTCGTTYCHGAFTNGGAATPTWGGTAACGTCHGLPPPVTSDATKNHPNNTACDKCHGAGYSLTAVDKTKHIDGLLQKPNKGCANCHGDLTVVDGTNVLPGDARAAPGYAGIGVDTTGVSVRSDVSVGAHVKHVSDGMMAGNCTACHSLPAEGNVDHANAAPAVTFNVLAGLGVTESYLSGNCTVYCHSSGVPLGSTTATPKSPGSWTSTVALDCTGCHAAAPATNAHTKHVSASTYGVDCQACHATTTDNGTSIVAGGGVHVNGTNNVGFTTTDPFWAAYVSGAGYTSPGCSTVYCHSNGNGGYTSPTWNGGTYTGCTQCHGGYTGTIMATGKHGNHANNAGLIGKNYECDDCHATTVAGGATPTVDYAGGQHVDRTKDVSIQSRGTFPSTDTTASCSATYCHSSGRPTSTGSTTPSKWAPVTWSDAAWGAGTSCLKCHGTYTSSDGATYGGWLSNFGEPNYTSGGPNVVNSNSHKKHATSAATCAICHQQTTANGTTINSLFAIHTDGQRQVTWDTDRTTGGALYDPSTKKCSSVTCHGTGQPVWGGSPQLCSDCHTGAADNDSFAFGTAGIINTTEWTGSGHGNATLLGVNALPTIAAGKPCLYCHDENVSHDVGTNPFRLNGATPLGGVPTAGSYVVTTDTLANAPCLNCHGGSGNGVNAASQGLKTATKKVDAWHLGSKHTTTFGGRRCWDCHDPHGDANIKMVGKTVVKVPNDLYSFANAPTARVTGVAFTVNATGTDYANTSTSSVCRACHVTALHYNATTNDGHQSGTKCVACHSHDQPTNLAFMNSTACNACHNAPPTLGKHGIHDATTFSETSYTNNARHASATQYGFACNTCHNDAAGHMSDNSSPYAVGVTFGSFDTTAVGGTYVAGVAQTGDTAPTGLLTFSWTGGTCNTTYCHSNGSPVGGMAAYAAPKWTDTWTAGTQCVSCHKMSATTTVPDTNLSHSHQVHTSAVASGGYFYNCSQCHNGVATGASDYPTTAGTIVDRTKHVSGPTHNVAFDVTFNPGTTGYAQGPAYTCSNTYCHSNGTNAASPPANTSIAWTATKAADCSSCHGGNSTAAVKIATNDHAAHVNQAAGSATPYLGTNIACGRCHAATVDQGDDRAIKAIASHVNRAADVSMVNADATAGGTYSGSATKQCSSTYCHSDGTEIPGNFTTMDWDLGTALANDCIQCHGKAGGAFPSQWGEPNYTNVNTADDTRNSHQKHVSTVLATAKTQCVDCHASTVVANDGINDGKLKAGGTHLNKLVEITTGGKIGGYTAAGESCTTITCHNGGNAVWGGTLTCSDCHTSTTADVNNWSITDDVPSAIKTTSEWLTTGHGNTTVNFAGANICLYCHDDTVSHAVTTNPFRLRGASTATNGITGAYNSASATFGNDLCLNCHKTDAATRFGVDPDGASAGYVVREAATKFVDTWHHGDDHTAAPVTTGGKRCWDCHDPHGDTNLHMIGADVLPNSTDAYGLAGTRVTVAFTSEAAGGYTRTATPWTGVCQACHTKTTYWTNIGGGLTHNSGTDCISCHTHNNATKNYAFEGAGACSACHLAAVGAGDQDEDDYVYGTAPKAMIDRDDWEAYGHGATVANYAQSGNVGANFPVTSTVEGCYYCHAPETALYTGGPTSVHQAFTGSNPFRLANVGAGVTAADKNGNCLVCHGVGSGGFDPDGAGTVFTLPKAANKEISATHYGAAHSATGDGGMFCWDCHDPHGDYNYTVGTARAIGYMIHEQPVRDHSGSTGWGVPTTLALAVDFNKAVGGTTTVFDWADYVDSTATVGNYNGVCQVCHTSTNVSYFRQTLYTAGHNNTQRCTSCHTHQQPPGDAFYKAGDCLGCHASRVGAGTATERHAITGGAAGSEGDDFVRKSRHVANGSTTSIVKNVDCILCHMEGDAVTSTNALPQTSATLHGGDTGGNKNVDLRNVDSSSGGTAIVSWTGTRLVPLAAGNTTLRNGMDSFCMGCHDVNGASNICVNSTDTGLERVTTGACSRRFTPFNTGTNIRNANEPAGGAVDTWRQANNKVINVKDQFNSTNQPGKAWASHHNLKQFTPRYTSKVLPAAVWTPSRTTMEGVRIDGATGAGETAGLHCSDCHLNEANAHGTRLTWYMLSNTTGTDALFVAPGASNSTDVCARCHNPAVYGMGNTDASSSRVDVHNPAGARCDQIGETQEPGFAMLGYTGSTNQLPCLGCHGGYGGPSNSNADGSGPTNVGPGLIHGTNATYKPWESTTWNSRMFRFLGTGGSYRYYSPVAGATGTDTSWEGTSSAGCYTISAAYTWGSCAQHGGGKTGPAANYSRPLTY
ncbi:MAG: CxxxxCH/CxxCH domain-containing protein [Anaeromyxobacteraceae bacterium]